MEDRNRSPITTDEEEEEWDPWEECCNRGGGKVVGG